MGNYVTRAGLEIDADLCDFVETQACAGLTLSPEKFWHEFAKSIRLLAPKNRALLEKRDDLQDQLDQFYKLHRDVDLSAEKQEEFYRKIGFLVPSGPDFSINVTGVDPEIASIPGPQLIVPIKNARYALNAANARWGSLFNALYGSDAIDSSNGKESTGAYNPVRGQAVIERAFAVLDESFALDGVSHAKAEGYQLDGDNLVAQVGGASVGLQNPEQFCGYNLARAALSNILLQRNGLHIDIHIDRTNAVGQTNAAGICDIMVESAVTTIQDFEDSVAAVDAQDKLEVYSNWLGLMKGTLSESFEKNGKTVTRQLLGDREYIGRDGKELSLPGRALLLARNVGHLMMSDAVRCPEGNEIPEGILDSFITVLCAIHNLNGQATHKNSRAGSVYIVKPKMQGPEEVAFADELFSQIEKALGLVENTIKIGVMDEEKRTTLNLRECIRAVKNRIVFINTGFLDRTGAEIRNAFEAGAFIPKSEMKNAKWLQAYEDGNVDAGLATGFSWMAQIGKGMWAMPDEMAQMMKDKIAHPMSGANCAWVPSPTAATLHALHYFACDVFDRQAIHLSREGAKLHDLLELPILRGRNLSDEEIQAELRNNAQGILGYVVRWINQGIGCSKVPNIDNVGLMEDRATLRISSQILANWLHHGVCTKAQVQDVLAEMAALVDGQNAGDKEYVRMSDDIEASIAYNAACELVFLGMEQPDGYTEPLLHHHRRKYKASIA